MADPPLCRFTLSVPPPSTNNIYRGGPRFKTNAYASWATSAGWEVKAQHVKSVTGRLRVRIEVPFRKNRDLDNIKPLLDLAASLGLIENDNRVDELLIVRVAVDRPTVVEIEGMTASARMRDMVEQIARSIAASFVQPDPLWERWIPQAQAAWATVQTPLPTGDDGA